MKVERLHGVCVCVGAGRGDPGGAGSGEEGATMISSQCIDEWNSQTLNFQRPSSVFRADHLAVDNPLVCSSLGRTATQTNPSRICVTSSTDWGIWLQMEDSWNRLWNSLAGEKILSRSSHGSLSGSISFLYLRDVHDSLGQEEATPWIGVTGHDLFSKRFSALLHNHLHNYKIILW